MEGLEAVCAALVKREYVHQGLQSLSGRNNRVRQLIEHKKLPKTGWDDFAIEQLLLDLSAMDSNNFASNCGVGEREGRIYSNLVRRRHYGLAHGIGRSGDISEVQPKAAGSSLLYALSRHLVTHAMNIAGLNDRICSHANPGLLVPVATGMSIALTMMALRTKRSKEEVDLVIFSRIDQKSCYKSILTAGCEPIVVENELRKDEHTGEIYMQTNINEIERQLALHAIYTEDAANGQDRVIVGNRVMCVLSTTSCFAPRQPDSVDSIAKLCTRYHCAHVINNAYGLQCPQICKLINRAHTVGRVDAVIHSTDKNFCVPVGGAIICSSNSGLLNDIASLYPGRASAAPIIDLFITLLSMGESLRSPMT
jgi:O-phospho-L-seryl-tRNASec:L-selenocysteinyl-tRNA synthase